MLLSLFFWKNLLYQLKCTVLAIFTSVFAFAVSGHDLN